MKSPRVLIIEDNRALSLALAAAVSQSGATSDVVATAMQARDQLQKATIPFTAMILDIGLPDMNGLEFLKSLPMESRPPTIVITAHGELDNTIQARKLGVHEFLRKPLEFGLLKESLNQLLAQSTEDAKALEKPSAYIGAAQAMQPIFQQIAHACATEVPVLISGETGTGKSVTADLICRNGPMHTGESVLYRPSPENQLEEIRLALEKARGGVLVLDNLKHLNKSSQTELLHQWENESSNFPRIIAISDSDLRTETESGRFRNDLFYRLQVLEIRLPALRERMEDLPALFSFFLAQFQPGRSIFAAKDTLNYLEQHPWTGNLLELRNVASYAVTACGSGNQVMPIHLPEYLRDAGSSESSITQDSLDKALDQWIEDSGELNSYQNLANSLERKLIHLLLQRFDGKLARMATAMQANRTTLRKKLRHPPEVEKD